MSRTRSVACRPAFAAPPTARATHVNTRSAHHRDTTSVRPSSISFIIHGVLFVLYSSGVLPILDSWGWGLYVRWVLRDTRVWGEESCNSRIPGILIEASHIWPLQCAYLHWHCLVNINLHVNSSQSYFTVHLLTNSFTEIKDCLQTNCNMKVCKIEFFETGVIGAGKG